VFKKNTYNAHKEFVLQALQFFEMVAFYFSFVFHHTRQLSWGKKNPLRSLCNGIDLGHGLFTYHIKTLGENHSTKEHATLCKAASM
jgi:hypothetical protein